MRLADINPTSLVPDAMLRGLNMGVQALHRAQSDWSGHLQRTYPCQPRQLLPLFEKLGELVADLQALHQVRVQFL